MFYATWESHQTGNWVYFWKRFLSSVSKCESTPKCSAEKFFGVPYTVYSTQNCWYVWSLDITVKDSNRKNTKTINSILKGSYFHISLWTKWFYFPRLSEVSVEILKSQSKHEMRPLTILPHHSHLYQFIEILWDIGLRKGMTKVAVKHLRWEGNTHYLRQTDKVLLKITFLLKKKANSEFISEHELLLKKSDAVFFGKCQLWLKGVLSIWMKANK